MSKKFIDEVIGTYKGYQYIVKLSHRGHRCGYIKINDHKLWSEIEKSYRDWDYKLDLDIKVHGGVTFVESYSKSDYLPFGDWIGFDCLHLGDFPDINAMILNFPFDKQKILTAAECNYSEFEDLKIWYKEDVENECKNVICQLHDYIEQNRMKDAGVKIVEKPKPTNGDVIRQGGNRALAEILDDLYNGNKCKYCIHHAGSGVCSLTDQHAEYDEGEFDTDEVCPDGIEAWLNAPAESEGEDE